MFFEKFPSTLFEVSKTQSSIVTDFIRAVKIDPKLKEDDIFYDFYEAADGETPEIISHKVYGTTQFHWVIMLVNEKFDPWRDFPQPESVIRKFASEKYTDINAIHHYEDSNGNWVDQFYVGSSSIKNLEYELQQNELNRTVKILKRAVLDAFVDEYENLIAR